MKMSRFLCSSLSVLLLVAGLAQGQLGRGEEVCNERLQANFFVQEVSTPGFPFSYPSLLSCTWSIEAATPGYQVELQFVNVLTETCCDYIIVRDGDSLSAGQITTFRGNFTIRNFVSTFGSLYITFVSDEDISGRGFRFQYRQFLPQEGCGENVRATRFRKYISSPGFPNKDYPSNSFCLWTITAPIGSKIFMFLENATMIENCCDNLLIRDGEGSESSVFGYFSGITTSNYTFRSTGNTMQVRFRSDSSLNFRGFRLWYHISETSDPPAVVPPPPRNCNFQLRTSAAGPVNFTSPNYPDLHASELMCSWIIRAPFGERIRVWFAYVNTEACCDWIKIRDGVLPSSPKIGVLSGNPLEFRTFLSTSNVVRVEFDTDSLANGRGFIAYYEEYDPEAEDMTSTCGGNLDADSSLQYLSSPNWPEPYESNARCVWVITANSGIGQIVRVALLGVITAPNDRIEFYDGRVTSSEFFNFLIRFVTLTGRYRIGSNSISSSGSVMTIIFESDDTVNFGGFRLSYTAVSGKRTLF